MWFIYPCTSGFLHWQLGQLYDCPCGQLYDCPGCQWSNSVGCGEKWPVQTATKPINSLAPGKFEWNFRHVIFKQILVIDGWGISCEIAVIWMSLGFTDDQSTLVQVMAWCRQTTSHYMSQCWPRSLSPYGITRPQWVIAWTTCIIFVVYSI